MNDNPIGYKINEVAKLFRCSVKNLAMKQGVSSTYFAICHYLSKNQDKMITQKDICENTNMKAPTISLAIQAMEKEELIYKEKSDIDSRAVHINLTAKGLILANKVRDCFKNMDNVLIQALDDNELEEFYKILNKLKMVMVHYND